MSRENGDAARSGIARRSRPKWLRTSIAPIIILLAVLGWFLARQVLREPVYGGKALSLWLRTYAPSSPSVPGSREWKETDEAVRSIGTDCIPVLLDMLRQRDSQLKLRLVALARKQRVIRIHFVPAPERNIAASRAFIVLGDNARGAVPELAKMLDENLAPESRSAIEDALAFIGPSAEPAIPMLLRAARSSNPRVRANALWALGEIHAQAQLCVPVLMHALSDSDDGARSSAAHALGGFGAEARPAVPQLKELTEFPKQSGQALLPVMLAQVMLEAEKALKKIDPAAASTSTNVSPSEESVPEFGFPTSD